MMKCGNDRVPCFPRKARMTALSKWMQSDCMKAFAASRKLPWLFAALAVIVTLPALWTGYWEDDHLFLMRFKGLPNVPTVQGNLLDINVSGDGNPERNHARMDDGTLPWWTDEHWKIAFWRPLVGISHYADWWLFGDRPWVMHAHNVIVYGVMIFVLLVLYRRMLTPPWAGALAGLMYLLDAGHAGAVGWIATRNAPLSAIFVVLVIYFHDRWRRDGWRPGLWAALVSLALGLLASEVAVAAGAYLAGYAMFVDTPRSPARRFAALLPYLAVVIVWRAVYETLGYGVGGTMLYTDPVAQPGTFVLNMVRHLPVMLACMLAALEPGLSAFLSQPWNTVFVLAAVAALGFMTWVLWPLLRRDRMSRFWAAGMVLSTLPVCTTFPQGRELMNPGIGAFALMALFLGQRASMGTAAREAETPRYRRAAKVLAVAWIVLHVVAAAPMAPFTAYTAGSLAVALEQGLNATAPSDDAFSTLVTVYLPGDLLCSAVPLVRAAGGGRVPPYGRTLCAGVGSVEIERPSDRTLIIRPDDGFLRPPYCQVFRNPEANPMYAGQVIRLTGFRATVLSVTADGRPKEVAFEFDVPLEDPSLRWVTFQGKGYVPFTLPEIGQTILVTGPTLREFIDEWFLDKHQPSQGDPATDGP